MTKMLPRFLAVITVAVALPLAYAGAAAADVPEWWPEADDVSFMYAFLVLVGIPLLCIVLVALAVYLPSVVRGESLAPAGVRPDDAWFGGRRDTEKALEQSKGSIADETGGASGSW